jgi:cell wall-associated NlpC family hydrolase
MKNLKRMLVVSIVFLTSMFYINTVNAANTAKIASETVRIRKEASTTSTVVELVSLNEEVEILETKDDWYKVKYKNITGYVKADLLKLDESEESEEEQTPVEETTTQVQEEEQVQEQEDDNQNQDNENLNLELTVNQEITVKSDIELKILPLINVSNISTIKSSTKVQIKEIINDWCYVQSDTNSGWVRKNKLSNMVQDSEDEKTENQKEETTNKKEEQKEESTETTTTKTGYVNVDTVNLRKEMSTSSTILLSLSKNTAVKILGEKNNWYNIEVNGTTGYIASKYISDKKVETEVTSRGSDEPREAKDSETTSNETVQSNSQVTNTTPNTTANTTANTQTTTASTTTSSNTNQTTNNNTTNTNTETTTTDTTSTTSKTTGDEVVAYAKKYLGYKYVSGGASPSTGFDCSGFTTYVFKHFGISLSRTSSAQRNNGKKVEKSDLQPGDIVCFTGHVGIYIGGNQFIHAANPSKGVIITSLSDSYYVKNYITARRVL